MYCYIVWYAIILLPLWFPPIEWHEDYYHIIRTIKILSLVNNDNGEDDEEDNEEDDEGEQYSIAWYNTKKQDETLTSKRQQQWQRHSQKTGTAGTHQTNTKKNTTTTAMNPNNTMKRTRVHSRPQQQYE